MHDIQTSSHEIGFDSQVRSILAIGIRQLGLRVGLVSKLNRDQIGMPYVVGGGDSLPEGTVVRACDSFCGEAIARRSCLVFEDAETSEFRDHPGHTVLGLKAYLGQPIYVDDVVWGTVCFLDTKPLGRSFTEVDLDLFELICQRIQVGIEHESVLTGFRAVLGGTANVTGEGFFRSLVAELCRGLRVDTAFVAERIEDETNGGCVRTLAVWNDGALSENFEYSTFDTPSADLGPHHVTCHPDDVQRLFPNDRSLAQTNRRGYAGIGLNSHEGRPLGHLVASSRERLDLKTHEKWLIEIFAARAGAELDRLQSDAEQRRLEREMLHGEKLKSLGILAGGIAHDFNNLLAGIVGNVGLIQTDTPVGSDLAQRLAQIETASNRAERLTKQMLAYSGRGALVVEPMDLNAAVQDVTELLDSAVSKSVILERSFADALPCVDVDITQIRQVLMNLIMNASDAFDQKPGIISLRTGLLDLSVEDLRDYLLSDRMTAGSFVYIEVEDAGMGMTAETQRRMFDPFFTMKESGSGRGLSTTLGIVRGHRGGMQVRSEEGVGTCIRVLFPASGAKSLETVVERRPRWVALGGTALVVDDEEVVRNVATEILSRCGMSLLSARDGIEAVELFQKHQAEIDVVLLDLSMPRLDGRSAAKRIRQHDPEVPIIVTSGYDEQEATLRFKETCCDGFLQKPFTAASLMTVVQRLIQPATREASATRTRYVATTFSCQALSRLGFA